MQQRNYWLAHLPIVLVAAFAVGISGEYALLTKGKTTTFILLALSVLALLVLARPVYLVATRHHEPIKQLLRDAVTARWWAISAVVIAISISVTLAGTTAIKAAIPFNQPFYLDPMLRDIDKVLFFGVDPWRVSHAVFGPIGTRVIDLIYAGWHFAQLGFLVAILLAPNWQFRVHAAIAYQLSWVFIGAGLATALSSVGPCFYEIFFGSGYYAPLMDNIHRQEGLFTTPAMTYLLDNQYNGAIGSGISAMPSMHVGIAVLIALALRSYVPRFQWLGWTFAAFIWVGSFHLGWHYAVDGLVSGPLAAAIWYATAFAMQRTGATDTQALSRISASEVTRHSSEAARL